MDRPDTGPAPTDPPAGWYLDPANPAGQRYWDGRQWTVQTNPSLPVAGWYPDPTHPGHQRHWDGRQWTDQARKESSLAATPADQARQDPPLAAAAGAQVAEEVDRPPAGATDTGRRRLGEWPVSRPMLIGLAVLVLVGSAAAAAYVLVIRSEGACVASSTGESVDCGRPGAVSEQDYRAQEARRARTRRAAGARAERCRGQVEGFLASLRDLDARLPLGLQYAGYSHRLGQARGAYDRIPFRQLAFDCLTDVSLPAEHAMNSYAEADATWNGCLTRPGCDTDGIELELRRRWLAASRSLEVAHRGLAALAQP